MAALKIKRGERYGVIRVEENGRLIDREFERLTDAFAYCRETECSRRAILTPDGTRLVESREHGKWVPDYTVPAHEDPDHRKMQRLLNAVVWTFIAIVIVCTVGIFVV